MTAKERNTKMVINTFKVIGGGLLGATNLAVSSLCYKADVWNKKEKVGRAFADIGITLGCVGLVYDGITGIKELKD